MTKEITKSIILQEMQDKLKLREYKPTKFLFDETVVPVYNIEQHLVRPETGFVQLSITAGPAAYAFYTVPPNEKWVLNAYNVIFMAAGAYKVTGVYVARPPGFHPVYLDMKEGQTVSYSHILPTPAPMHGDDKLVVYVDDYTSTANLRLYIDVVKEEIR